MIVVFVLLALLVVGCTAAALAGRWRPEGLADGRPQVIEPDAGARFDVAIRGYRMDQVDRELARLHEELIRLRGELAPAPIADPGSAPGHP